MCSISPVCFTPPHLPLGVALYLDGIGLIRNNSIIRATATGRFNQLQCISGSTVASVGQWVSPSGVVVNGGQNSTFIVTTGDASDPGFTSLEPRTGVSLQERDEGVYTCAIPDENGNLWYLFIGIYRQGFNSMPASNSY